MNVTQAEQFFARVDAEGDCWQWTGSDNGKGYGVIQFDGRLQRVHRLSWEYLVGPIPDGLVLDHLCRNKRCVNPDHLEPVTNRENVLRGYGISAQLARNTECPNGHPFSGDNLIITDSGRRCRICNRATIRKARRRLKAQFEAGRSGIRHGTVSGYTLGCRCEHCKQARSDYDKARSARLRAQAGGVTP
jgi:hypothetical protein